MGYIYIIKNTVNDKVYIGQTINTIEKRYRGHKVSSCRSNSKLYKNMRSIGLDKFYIEEICKCDNSMLNKLEIEYISKYDSYKNGYNSTQGGCGGEHNEMYEEELSKKFIEDYYNMTLVDMCIKYNISESFLYSLLSSFGVECKKEKLKTRSNNISIAVNIYSKQFELVKSFKSIKEALDYCEYILGYKVNRMNGYGRIKSACQNGNIAYGHRWQLLSDLVYDNKTFRTKFDKEAYIQGKPAYQPEGKQYYIVDGVLDKYVHEKIICKCSECGKYIEKVGTLCKDCYAKKRKEHIPDKNTLQELISEHSYEEIGRRYNVTGKSVRKWCDMYGIRKLTFCTNKPNKEQLERLLDILSTREIAEKYNVTAGTVNWWARNFNIKRSKGTKVKCVELDIKFDSKCEAARYLIENNLIRSTDAHNIAYKIGESALTKTKYANLHWELI